MKVLFVLIQKFNPILGGVERSTYKISKFLATRGCNCAVYSLDCNTNFELDNVTVERSLESGNYLNEKNIEHLCNFILKIKPDIIINQSPYYLNSQISDVIKKIDIKYLACLRQSLFMFKDNYELQIAKMGSGFMQKLLLNPLVRQLVLKRHDYRQKKILKHILNVHTKYIMLTESNIGEIQYFVGKYKEERLHVIPNSIPFVNQIDFNQKEKILLHVGRLNTVQKKSDLLLPLWEKVSEKLKDWKFVIVGDGDYYKELKEKSKSLERIEVVGYQAPDTFYHKASLFMMPSAYEGFPNTLIEAQSYGCFPFVFDSYAALRDIVNDENAGISEPFNIEDMADNIVRVAKDSQGLEKRMKMALGNAKKYTIDNVGKMWIELFKQELN
ncbi:MAG: glycosyltransferase [Bacteroidia bacterium]